MSHSGKRRTQVSHQGHIVPFSGFPVSCGSLECPPAKRGGGNSGGARPVYIRRITLERDIEDPQLALNEAFSTRMASFLAEGLRVSVGGLAEGVGALGRKGAELVGETTKRPRRGHSRAVQRSEEK